MFIPFPKVIMLIDHLISM
ncbi:hypothetical protein OIU79_015419 [Salix purpurea]|uniref:Uncharacterized protein n=1 Tax=Salix purpurea TaxID=77065 RepID=A0A9Q0PBZ0_SALPP|nr:hypothetical protein OIU79_015419 [Salix purpurea]